MDGKTKAGPDIPLETKLAFRALHALPETERAFVLAWFCHCGRYLNPHEPSCRVCGDEL